jgi:6-phosphogluconolactonase
VTSRPGRLLTIATVLLSLMGGACGTGVGAAGGGNSNPPPSGGATISSVTPPNANAGGAGLAITVSGEGFASNSTVNWNGTSLITTTMGNGQLAATVPAADIATAGAAQITVVNPGSGGGTSNPLAFVINGAAPPPTPGFVYVANSIGVSLTTGNISAFSVDPNTGVLAPIPGSPFPAGAEPTALTTDPSGKFLFEASNLESPTPVNDISAFTINSSTGALTTVAGSPFLSGVSPLSLAVDSSGKFLFTADSGGEGNVTNNSISEYSINATTGALTPASQAACQSAAPAGFGLANAVATHPTAGFLFVSSVSGVVCSFSINAQGTLQPVAGSPFSLGTNPLIDPRGVAIDPFGKYLYTANYEGGDVSAFSIAQGGGALTAVAGSPFTLGAGGFSASWLVVDPLGRFLYVLDFDGGVSGFSINPSTGAISMLAGFPINLPIQNPKPLAVDPSGEFLYVGTEFPNVLPSVSSYAINETTGVLTAVPGSPFSVDGSPQAVTVTHKAP